MPASPLRAKLPQSVADSVNELVRVRQQMPKNAEGAQALDDWKRDVLAPAKLRAAQSLSAVAHRDLLPPSAANQTYVRLVGATQLLCNASKAGANFDDSARVRLHSLLLTGEMNNRWVSHACLKEEPVPRFQYRTHANAAGTHMAESGSTGTRMIAASPKAFNAGGGTVMAHEVLHASQSNVQKGLSYPYSQYAEKKPRVDTNGHARAHQLETARNLPPYWDSRGSSDMAVHFAHAMELQCLVEQSRPWAMGEERRAGAPVGELPEPALQKLAALLADAAHELESRSLLSKVGSRLFGEEPLPSTVDYDLDKARQIPAQVQRILLATASLQEAAQSEGWSNTHSQRFTAQINAVATALDTAGDRASPTRRLEAIASTLDRLVDGLQRGPSAHQLRMPRGSVVSAAEASADKTSPIAVLQRRLQAIAAQSSAQAPDVSRLRASLVAACGGGFADTVKRMQAGLLQGTPPDADDVHDAVLGLAGQLLGVPLDQWPETALPVINLFEGPTAKLPFIPGLNEAPQQKRKAFFEPMTRQLHVPTQMLEDPSRLAERMGRLAADVAYHVSALLTHDGPDDKERATGMYGAQYGALLDHLDADVQPLRQPVDAHVRGHPQGVGAMLHLLTKNTPVHTTDAAWQEGLRAAFKALAKTESADGPYSQLLRSNRHQRWQRSPVAFRRAVAEAAKASVG